MEIEEDDLLRGFFHQQKKPSQEEPLPDDINDKDNDKDNNNKSAPTIQTLPKIKLIHHLNLDNHLDDLYLLFQSEWWTKTREKEDLAIMIQNSDILFGLVVKQTNQLVGFARVLTGNPYAI